MRPYLKCARLVPGLLVLTLAGCDQRPLPTTVANKPSDPPASPPVQVPAPEIGRFTIIHSPQVERDTMLVDTVTGQTWQLVSMTAFKGDPLAWQPVPQVNTQQDYAALEQQYGPKAKPALPQ